MSTMPVPMAVQSCLAPDGRLCGADLLLFLQQYAPDLHLADGAFVACQMAMPLTADAADRLRTRMRIEGHFQHRPSPTDWGGLPLAAMRDAVGRLAADGIPPVFAFVFDEFWLAYAKLGPLIRAALGRADYQLLPDFWAWHVDAQTGGAGWAMHRDLGARALASDGDAGAVSIWIPLVPVDTETGCMMLLPKNRDPDFGTDRLSQTNFDLRDVRALIGDAGDIMVWSQALMHWGGRGSALMEVPRISISMGAQCANLPAFNRPLLPPGLLPPAMQRLELIAQQLLQYERLGQVSSPWAHFARHIFASGLSGIAYELPESWRLR